MEGAVVVEASERIGLRLVLEARADVRVVERERRGVAESRRELELLLGEEDVVAFVPIEGVAAGSAGDCVVASGGDGIILSHVWNP